MAPLRVAILEADTPIPEIEEQFGRYGDIFANLFLTAGATMTPPMTADDFYFTKWDVEKSELYPDINDVDHIVITGSRMCSC